MWEVSNYKYKCKKCGYQTTVIAGTLFQDAHVPLTIWFRAIWYVTSQTNKVKASELQRVLGLGSNRTALKMLNKIRCAMLCSDVGQLHGTVEVGRQQIRGTNPRKYLAVAVEVAHTKAGQIRAGIVNDTSFESMNEFVKKCVAPGSIIQSDCWDGRNQEMNQIYTYRQRLETYEFPYADKVFQIFFNVTGNETAEYFDAYCARYNSQKAKITFEALLNNAVRSEPIPYADSYVFWKKLHE